MNFFNPLGFLGLLSLPIIIILYTVKQKSKIKQVSSLYLWDKIRTDKSGTSFFKRLRNNPFLYLDLLAALLITLALTEAYINRTAANGSLIIVIDNSLTMQSDDVKPSRLEEAKKQAISLIDNKGADTLASVITLNDEPQIIANRQTDKPALIKAINSVKPTFGGADGEKAAALIDSLNGENTRVYILSDDKLDLGGEYESVNLREDTKNCAVTNLSMRPNQNGGVSLFAMAQNYGTEPVEKNINIFADNKIIDTFLVTIQPGARTQVLADTDFMPSEAVAELSPQDCLAVDDTRYLTIAGDSIKKVLLISKGNVFLEKALNAQPDVELYKGDEYTGASGYDCYVFDGISADKYPTDGDLMFFGVDEQKLFKTTDDEKLEEMPTATGKGGYFNDLDFSVLSSRGIESKELEPMLTADERTVMARGKINGQSVFVCGFDLHNSDLPLKMDFPILIYNILNDFDESRLSSGQFTAGKTYTLDLKADTVKAEIEDPEGKRSELKNAGFTPDRCGIYKLYENERQTAELSVNCEPVSAVRGSVTGSDEKIKVNYKLRKIFLMLALAVLIAHLVLYFMRIKPDWKILVLRAMIFLLILGSITDFSFTSKTKNSDTVFLLDASQSMEARSTQALEFVNDAVRSKPNGDYSALMLFGGNAAVDSGLATGRESYVPTAVVDTSQTNIEKAVNTAEGLFTDERGKHIVLITDGRETNGSILSLKNSGAVIDVADFSSSLEKEAQISRITLPSKISKNSDYSITLKIDSLTAQGCGAAVYKNDKVIYNQRLELEKGENRFIIRDHADEVNNVVYKCVITPDEDTYAQNNVLYKHTYIRDVPVVMVLEHGGSGENVFNLVSSFGVNAKRADIAVFMQHPEELGQNDLVIMADCSAYDMTDEFLENIEGYVKNSAGGLIVTGGANSYALGGYKDTLLEEILPVNMDMLNEEVNGDVAFFMVSDRSGSMAGGEYGKDKLTMAKEAMAGAVKNLNPNDTVAVIAFDTEGEWIVPPMEIGKNSANIIDKISKINLGGGTSILPSLQMAYDKITQSDAAYKHIILMTDGQAETSGYDHLIAQMVSKNITLSTIAVGSDADTSLLESLAKQGGGRYYYTDEFSNLPNIFSREAKLAGRDYINSDPFYPAVSADDDVLKNVGNIPRLGGYIATKNKSASKMILSTELGEPVLSRWQYGLGRTAAFTSDMENFCGDWLSADEGRTIFRNLVSSVMRSPTGLDGEISYTEDDEKGTVTIRFNDPPNELEGGSINNKSTEFVRTSIGEYKAETPKLEQGSYIVNAVFKDSEGNEKVINDGIDIGYSREFDINNQKNALLSLNAENINFITDPYSVFAEREYTVNHSLILYKWLLPPALLLLLAEVFLRRIGAVKLPEKQKKEKPKQETAEPEPENTAHMLLSNKRNRGR
ncbi:MAG: VWA domain-containing protein [Firmicutes bacterium]|nr:VWA domain-containing protein [Bacillota bacterium]